MHICIYDMSIYHRSCLYSLQAELTNAPTQDGDGMEAVFYNFCGPGSAPWADTSGSGVLTKLLSTFFACKLWTY